MNEEPKPEIVKVTLEPVRQICNWIIEGRTKDDIVEAIEATWPKRKPKPLIIEALKQIAQAGDPDAAVIRGFAIEGTRMIYSKCLEVADLQTALRALRQLVDLTGVPRRGR